MNTVIYSFVKNKRGTVGVVLASKKTNGKVAVGWSRCAVTRGDVFNKEIALKIATGRAEKGTVDTPPHSMFKAVASMEDRAKRYFKDAEVQIANWQL